MRSSPAQLPPEQELPRHWQVYRVLGLQEVPDHAAHCRTYAQLRLRDLEQVKRALLDRLGVEEELIALDSTSFERTGASACYLSRRGQVYREWLKDRFAAGLGLS